MQRQRRTVRLGPGQIYTGWCRRACDGAVVELLVRDADGVIDAVKVREVHDIGVVGLKADRETAWYLKRCVAAMAQEGLLLIVDGEVHTVSPDRVDLTEIAYQQYLSPNESAGPFRQ